MLFRSLLTAGEAELDHLRGRIEALDRVRGKGTIEERPSDHAIGGPEGAERESRSDVTPGATPDGSPSDRPGLSKRNIDEIFKPKPLDSLLDYNNSKSIEDRLQKPSSYTPYESFISDINRRFEKTELDQMKKFLDSSIEPSSKRPSIEENDLRKGGLGQIGRAHV